jgi:type IV pilus assembly protein PilE
MGQNLIRPGSRRGTCRGVTVIELMITVAVASILLAVAIPSYQAQVRRARRVEAKAALLDLVGREERLYSANGVSYAQDGPSLGYPAAAWPQAVADNFYAVTVCALGPGLAANCYPTSSLAPGYVVSARSINGQTADTQCAFFAVDNLGQRWAQDDNKNDTTTTCWNN